MRALIVGAGAVGGYFGAKLARAGNDVTFLARAPIDAARGLRIESAIGESFTVSPVKVVKSVEGLRPFDVVLVAVKAQDTAAALRGIPACLAPGAIVFSLQNGIETEETIERELAVAPMLRALAFIGAEVIASGVVRHASGGTVVVGELDGQRSDRLERLEAYLRGAGIEVRIPGDIRRAKWQKLAWNASFNVITAICGVQVGELCRDPAGRSLVAAVMAEVEAVAKAEGVPFEEDYIARVLRYTEQNLGSVRPSTLQDRDRGKPLENAALTGAVVRIGGRRGVATPVCRTLDTIAELISRGQR